MIIEVAKVGTQLAGAIGVTMTTEHVIARFMPATAPIAIKVCYRIAGASVGGALIAVSDEYFEKLFAKLENSAVSVKAMKEVDKIKEKKLEELSKAETEKEVIDIIVEAEKEIEETKKRIKEEAEEAKKAKKLEKERKRNLGALYKKASKKIEPLKKVK